MNQLSKNLTIMDFESIAHNVIRHRDLWDLVANPTIDGVQMVQEVYSIIDELAQMPESMPTKQEWLGAMMRWKLT
jgi:hypothetical protein